MQKLCFFVTALILLYANQVSLRHETSFVLKMRYFLSLNSKQFFEQLEVAILGSDIKVIAWYLITT